MTRLQKAVAVLLLLGLAGQTQAQGTISWSSGYPKAGAGSGAIQVQGTIQLDTNWVLATDTATIRVWQDGSCLYTGPASYDQYGNWSGSISGLTSGATYNVTVEALLMNTQDYSSATVITAPATATSN
jgi:hypothetical protein